MRMADLSEHFKLLEKTASRNAMTEMLSQLFAEASEQDIALICYLSLGRLAPLFERVDFNLAEKMVMRAIAKSVGKSNDEVLSLYKGMGDLGEVVYQLKTQGSQLKTVGQKSILSVERVHERLAIVAEENGQGSQERKVGGLAELLVEVDGLSAKYIVRMVMGRLRLGFSDKTILDALSVMETGNKKARAELEEAYQVFPNVGEIARLTKLYGYKNVGNRVEVTLGVPVMPALCQRLKTADEMVKKMGEVIVEPKYDGTRVQIHYNRGTGNNDEILRTFTRNLDETTHMFPELGQMGKYIEANALILDSEAVGIHPKTKQLLSFQATITRKRKHGIEEALRQVPLKFFVFDLLYLNGDKLLGLPLRKRRKMLEKVVLKNPLLEVAPIMVTKDADDLREFHKKQLGMGLEGVVIKKIDGVYIPGRRGFNWVKFKEVEAATGKLSDTIDCVVMGFYRGRGKRAQFGIGAFLAGVVDNKSGRVKTVAKIGTGLTDEQFKDLKRRLDEVVSVDKPITYDVPDQLNPDVWVDPQVIVEIAADEITKSPVHSAGKALRFPRLVRLRDDKDLSGTTTIYELKQIS